MGKMSVFKIKVWKSGNSLVVTIPHTVAEALKIGVGDSVEIIIRKEDED